MNIAVSNIAWSAEEEPAVADALQALDVRSVEIAPTKIFPNPTATTESERADYAQFWKDRGVSIVAFQSMLFGRPELQIFGEAARRAETIDVLSRFIELAGALGAGKLVFGSPKNRIVPVGMAPQQAQDIAVIFFGRLAQVARDNDTCFCIEPNPTAYDCNFVTTAAAGLAIVQSVQHPGFGLHLDSAGMTLAGDPLAASIRSAGAELAHFHASAPYLGALEESEVNHADAASGLRDIDYSGYVSIEMRPGQPGNAVSSVRAAVSLARRYYSTS